MSPRCGRVCIEKSGRSRRLDARFAKGTVEQMGLFDDAVAIAAGVLPVREDLDVLDRAAASQPIPLATYRSNDWCAVYFVIKLSSGDDWRTETVVVHRGEAGPSGGSTGGLVRRTEVEPGKPVGSGWFGCTLDDGTWLMSVDGVSADDAVRMVWQGAVVAEARVAPHGHFLLAATLPDSAEPVIESA